MSRVFCFNRGGAEVRKDFLIVLVIDMMNRALFVLCIPSSPRSLLLCG